MSDSEIEKDADDSDGGLLDGIVRDFSKKKRNREQLDESAEEIAAKTHKVDRIDPIIIYDIEEKLREKKELDKYLATTAINVNFLHVKYVINKSDNEKNKNSSVLIFVKDLDSKAKIMTDTNLFANCKKVDLGTVDKRPAIIIKDIIFNDAKEYEDYLSKNYGIIELVEMKNKKTNKPLNFIKAIIENKEKKTSLLSLKFIQIGIFRHFLDDFKRPPPQCGRCKQIGHIEKGCTADPKCSSCGKTDHPNEKCTTTKKTCANCGGEHSCYYRGCPKFLEAKKKIESNKNK